jgi:hypothetical protein
MLPAASVVSLAGRCSGICPSSSPRLGLCCARKAGEDGRTK